MKQSKTVTATANSIELPGVEKHPHGGDWLREIVFGLNDGLVTTLVFIMAVTGSAHDQIVMIVLGEVLAGGVSMMLGGYLSARTSVEVLEQRIATERFEVEHEPEEERAELRALYEQKGFSGDLLEQIITHLTANEDRWHHALVQDELGVVEDEKVSPLQQGTQIGIAFVVGGLIPTIPVLLALPQASWWAYGLTAVTALSRRDKIALHRQKPCTLWSGIPRCCYYRHACRGGARHAAAHFIRV